MVWQSITASKAELSTSQYALRLSNDGILTNDDDCGRLEKIRREQARGLHFRVAVFVNGSKVNHKGVQPGNNGDVRSKTPARYQTYQT